MATGFNTQVSNGEYRLQFETGNKEYYLLMRETARRCVDGKPVTNADRIRSMGDEELAEMLWKTGRNYRAVCADPAVDYTVQHEHIIDWLRKSAEGETLCGSGEMIMDVNEKKLAEEAREARNSYARKWRAANPDKVRANNANYWRRRAAKEAARKEAEER